MNSLKLSPKKTLLLLIAIGLLQFVFYVVSWHYLHDGYALGFAGEEGIVQLFDMDAEISIPTWYSQILFLVVSVLSVLIASSKKYLKDKAARYWTGLAFVFVYLSIDDGAMLHENMSSLGWAMAGTDGIFYYAWWVPMAIIILLLIALYSRFYLALPRKTQLLLAIAFVVFISGAIGFEMYAAHYYDTTGLHPSVIVVGIEEFLEITGVSLLIYALLDYLKHRIPTKALPKLKFN